MTLADCGDVSVAVLERCVLDCGSAGDDVMVAGNLSRRKMIAREVVSNHVSDEVGRGWVRRVFHVM